MDERRESRITRQEEGLGGLRRKKKKTKHGRKEGGHRNNGIERVHAEHNAGNNRNRTLHLNSHDVLGSLSKRQL